MKSSNIATISGGTSPPCGMPADTLPARSSAASSALAERPSIAYAIVRK
jgi:hypothetical protein